MATDGWFCFTKIYMIPRDFTLGEWGGKGENGKIPIYPRYLAAKWDEYVTGEKKRRPLPRYQCEPRGIIKNCAFGKLKLVYASCICVHVRVCKSRIERSTSF